MSDDELDRLLAEIAACRDADSFTGSNPSTARDRLRLAIDAAVRAEREACAKMADEAFDRHADAMEGQEEPEFCYHSHRAAMARCIAAAIRNRSNTP